MKQTVSADNAKDPKGLLPDAWDEKNIRNLIEMWDKTHPRGQVRYLQDSTNPKRVWVEYLNTRDHLDYMRTVVKQERKLTAIIPKRKGDPTRLIVSLPPVFASRLRKAYPTLLTDTRQTEWFLRKFPEFKL